MPSRNRLLALLFPLLALLAWSPLRAEPGHIVAGLVAEGPATPGSTLTLAVTMLPEKGWHGYWRNPGDAGLGLTLDWQLPQGWSAGALEYPVPRAMLYQGLMNHVFETDYAVLVPVKVPADARTGQVMTVRARASWLACTEQICVPESGEIATSVTVGPAGSASRDSRFDGWRAALPAPLGAEARFAVEGGLIRIAIPLPRSVALRSQHLFPDDNHIIDYAAPQEFRRLDDLLTVTLKRPAMAAIDPTTIGGVLRLNTRGDGLAFVAHPGPVPGGGELVPLDAARPALPLALLLLSALAGGLLLNVMPCVFPILSLKALSLARAGESPAEARAEGLAYTAGVVVACTALGGLLLALRAAGQEIGWAFQLQEPGVVFALLLLAAAITANLAGLYEFLVPGMARAGSPQGAFATGLLAAFAATPCTGPFMATAMGAALLLPTASALVLFATLGLGIALPFLAIAYVPVLRELLPRPGMWMVWFRRAMAVPMGLTALALVWLASRLGGTLFAASTAGSAALLVLVLWLLGRRQRSGTGGGIPVLLGLGAVLLISVLTPSLALRDQKPGAIDSLLPSKPFSEAALAKARSSGKPVFVYFTADWCLTCKVNERSAIEREEVRDAFAKAGVAVLVGDWTRRDPEITRFLTAQGAAGVPLYLWYAPGAATPEQLPQVLSAGLLVEKTGR